MLSICDCHQADLSLAVVSILIQVAGVLFYGFLVLHTIVAVAFTKIIHAQKSSEFFNFCVYSPFLPAKIPKKFCITFILLSHSVNLVLVKCPIRSYASELAAPPY